MSLWSLWLICPSSNSAPVLLGKTCLKNVTIQCIHWTSSKTVAGAVWWSLWTGVGFCLGSAPGTALLNPHVETDFLGKVGLLHVVSWLCLVWWYCCRAMWLLGCQWWECSLYSHTMPIKKKKQSEVSASVIDGISTLKHKVYMATLRPSVRCLCKVTGTGSTCTVYSLYKNSKYT